jgi:hypothetical protein
MRITTRTRGPVDVGGVDARASLLEHLAVALHEQLDRLADALSQRGRQLRLSLTAVEDGR